MRAIATLALVGAMILPAAVRAQTYADSVVSFTGGSGSGVFPGVEGEYDPAAVTALDGRVLALGGATGTPGTITLRFTTGSVFDGVGNDFIAYDTVGVIESLLAEGSMDGITFKTIGSFFTGFDQFCSPGSPCVIGFDLNGSGLGSASYFRLTAIQDGCAIGYPECFDLDALEAVNFRPGGTVPEPASWALMIGGMGLAGTAVRRRRVRTRAAFA